MNKKTRNAVILSAVICILVAAIFAAKFKTSITARENLNAVLYRADYSLEKAQNFNPTDYPLFGHVISVSDLTSGNFAKSGIKQDIELPKILGTPVFAKTVKGAISVVYFKEKISPDTPFKELIEKGAIVISESEILYSSDKEAEEGFKAACATIKKDMPDGFLREVRINEHPGVYGGNIEHVVAWYSNHVLFQITANTKTPFSALIKIAESMKSVH